MGRSTAVGGGGFRGAVFGGTVCGILGNDSPSCGRLAVLGSARRRLGGGGLEQLLHPRPPLCFFSLAAPPSPPSLSAAPPLSLSHSVAAMVKGHGLVALQIHPFTPLRRHGLHRHHHSGTGTGVMARPPPASHSTPSERRFATAESTGSVLGPSPAATGSSSAPRPSLPRQARRPQEGGTSRQVRSQAHAPRRPKAELARRGYAPTQ
uniref:Uncharacterized protein n=1 Tax=Oryza sativa subsp. japonica TaxID=39947 RepID=Q5Z860_ORYSJ|nr:hypothetical protein [Oryza sativa Japonica Group]